MEQANGRLTLIMHGNGDEKLKQGCLNNFLVENARC